MRCAFAAADLLLMAYQLHFLGSFCTLGSQFPGPLPLVEHYSIMLQV